MKHLPRIAPLKLKRIPKPFDHPEWVFELKHDGFRGLAYISDGACQLISSNSRTFKKFPPLSEALAKLRVTDAILDGEIVCLDDKGNSLLNELFHRRGQPYYYAFDLLWLNGEDLRPRPLLERKQRLREVLMRSETPVPKTPTEKNRDNAPTIPAPLPNPASEGMRAPMKYFRAGKPRKAILQQGTRAKKGLKTTVNRANCQYNSCTIFPAVI